MGFEQNGEKLIRHLIPARPTRIVEGEEHVRFLEWKLREEVGEVQDAAANKPAKLAEELADVRQVLKDFCTVTGIKAVDLRIPVPVALPNSGDARIALLHEWINKLVEAAVAVPTDEDDRIAYISDVLEMVQAIADIEGIRDAVRSEMARKLEMRGDFVAGVVWKIS